MTDFATEGKRIIIETKNDRGIFLYNLDANVDSDHLTKTAAEYHPDIAQYIRSAQAIPGKLQVLVTALGAHEYYGPNSNGDSFPEAGLKHEGTDYGYKTFEYNAKVFQHHVNKPDSPSYGEVRLSVWNDKMKRVELILIIDRAKAPSICERIDNGEYIPLSMGTKVPYDVCSICGNKAKNRKEYCEHLKFYMGRIPPGHTKKAYAINTVPRFFDISFVIIGADSIAKVMLKVAAAVQPPPRESGYDYPSEDDPEYQLAGNQGNTARFPRRYGLDKTASVSNLAKLALLGKRAEITKEVPSNIEGNISVPKIVDHSARILRANEPAMHPHIIRMMAGGAATPHIGPGFDRLNKVLSTLMALGIVPHRGEMAEIAHHAMGRPLQDLHIGSREQQDRLERLIEDNLNIHPDNFDDRIMSVAEPLMPHRSYAAPILHKRLIILVKQASEGVHINTFEKKAEIGPLAMMAFLAGVYSAFAKHNPEMATNAFEKFVANHTAITAALAGSAIVASKALLTPSYKGQYDVDPGTGRYSRPLSIDEYVARANSMPYVTKTGSIAARAFLGAPATYIWSGVEQARHERNPDQPEGFIGGTVRKHPDLLSAGLVGDALVGKALYSKPITSHLVSKGLDLMKAASMSGRMGFSAVDSAIIGEAAKLLQLVGQGDT